MSRVAAAGQSLIVTETEDFTVDESWFDIGSGPTSKAHRPLGQTFSTKLHEKEIIEATLAETAGRVSGPSGAAARLNMPASTLDYKIRILKINKYRFKTG
jgi:transcriptional regulator with GAF, ATPase, and Fis domain